MAIKFKEAQDLPIGSHEPCRLEECARHEPSTENLAKWPDMVASYCFRFVQHGSELDGHSAVRFVNESDSKLGHLYQFCCDLNGGEEPETFDPQDYVGRWYRVRVRKKTNGDKLHVAGVDPIPKPSGVDAAPLEDKRATDVAEPAEVGAADDGDDSIPF